MTTLGKYEVLFPLSVPGQASQTYLGTQRGFGGFKKLVLLREVLLELKGDDEAANQVFLEEVKAVAQFHHPNVADVFDLEAADGKLILATEFVPGATLEEVAHAFRVSKLRIPLGLVLMAVRDTALALHYAHTFTNILGVSKPVVHGALSAKTVQLTFEGHVKVLDFGRPKTAVVQRSTALDLTAVGSMVHQVFAESAQDVQLASRTDLTGELRTVLARLVAADPQQRFGSALDFAKSLEAVCAPVLWRPEQAAALVLRMFTERRDEIRQLLAQLEDTGSSTAVMPLSKIFAEGNAPPKPIDDPPTLPPSRRPAPPVPEEQGPDTLPPDLDTQAGPPEEQTRPRTTLPRPGGLSFAEQQTVIRPSGERPAVSAPPPPTPDDEPQTDVRKVPSRPAEDEPLPKKSGAGSRALRLFFVAVLLGLGLLVAKWRVDPNWVRVRSPELARALEKLAFIRGFPKRPSPPPEGDGLLEANDAGLDAALDAGGDAAEDIAGGDGGLGKRSADGGSAKAPLKPPPHHHHGR